MNSLSRRDFMKTAAVSCAAMASPMNTDAAIQGKPNVLFVICDDLNTRFLTPGYEQIETPALSSLAKESITFERAFCQYPVCNPSRASLMHGLYPQSTGVLSNTVDISTTRPDTISMPQYFRQNGYWTASVGKVFHSKRHEPGETAWNEFLWHENDELPAITAAQKAFEAEHGSIRTRTNRKKWRAAKNVALNPIGPDAPGYGPSGLHDEQHKDGKNARQVITWLKNKSYGDKPFFIAMGIQKPHVPFLAPDKYFDKYPKEKIKFHRDKPDLWDNIPSAAAVKRYKAFGFELGKENDPLRRSYTQAYYACVSFLDAQFGLVVKQLKDQGLWDNTIIVFTSDHGYHLGDHFLWGKVTLFDICTKVPFIVRVPGMTNTGSRSNAMVELVDTFPTLTELAGLETLGHLQGTSLVPLLRDPKLKGEKAYAYSVVTRRNTLGYAIRSQTWRYGKWPNSEELYDLTRDPHERDNLANNVAHSGRLKTMRKVLAMKQKLAEAKRGAPGMGASELR